MFLHNFLVHKNYPLLPLAVKTAILYFVRFENRYLRNSLKFCNIVARKLPAV